MLGESLSELDCIESACAGVAEIKRVSPEYQRSESACGFAARCGACERSLSVPGDDAGLFDTPRACTFSKTNDLYSNC